jgi:hypothetical protein
MKILRLVILFSVFLPISIASAIDLEGKYRCTGEDFLNQSTFDEPTVLKKSGQTYTFEWQNKNLKFMGTAIRLENTLSAIFWVPTIPSATPGVVTYKILPNGDLEGRWTIRNGEITGKEYCKRL